MLLRALQDDVAEDELCGAKPGRALGVSPDWHAEMMAGMVSIPEVQPGDTVWWHTDICHAVADEHAGKEYASVIYIGSAPDCPKNRAYLPKQKEAFLAGRSAPDFAAMDFEVDFRGRATVDDLTAARARADGVLRRYAAHCVGRNSVSAYFANFARRTALEMRRLRITLPQAG